MIHGVWPPLTAMTNLPRVATEVLAYRWNCQVMGGVVGLPQFFAKCGESGRVLIIAIHVMQQGDQFFESRGIDSTVFLQAILCPSAKLIEIPSCFGHADDRYIEMSSLYHRLQGGENLLVSQIASGAEENERVRVGTSHKCSPSSSLRFFLCFFQMSAKFETHCGQEFVGIVCFAA